MPTLTLEIPDWVEELVAARADGAADDDGRMSLAVALAGRNAELGGGPFGAVVFDGERAVGAGVNLVLASGYSIAHAEIVALLAAQRALGGGPPPRPLTLFTSAEPCCQCFGAVVWSGISRLVCAATRADVEAIGFDEGPRPDRWQDALRTRGIEVVEGVQRGDAARVLRDYGDRGGTLYGPGARRP
ncbi:MAG: nucleoside deaminase [Deltaproteobacteria bacterium]|nr:nucleoside deaminase [Deltaproteobacteria bacterium]